MRRYGWFRIVMVGWGGGVYRKERVLGEVGGYEEKCRCVGIVVKED